MAQATRWWRRIDAVGLLIVGLTLLLAVAAPLISVHEPWAMDGIPFMPPFQDWSFPLGTDTTGRDIWSGIAYGARISLLIGAVSTAIALVFGVFVGTVAGYKGGIIDTLLMRFTEIFQAVPAFALAVVLVAILEPNLQSIILAIALVGWPAVARLARGEVMAVRNSDYVLAARMGGLSEWRIMFSEILPNVFTPIVVLASLMVATAILVESGLSFLGLGDPNYMSWGFMIGASRTVLRQAWWMATFPGIAISLIIIGFNLLGESMQAKPRR